MASIGQMVEDLPLTLPCEKGKRPHLPSPLILTWNDNFAMPIYRWVDHIVWIIFQPCTTLPGLYIF
jgi:hypothetical protein